MPSSSSKSLGTQQTNTTETVLSSAKAKAEAETPEAVAETPEAEATTEAADTVTETPAATDDYATILAEGRERIDAIDEQILELVARRVEVAGELLTAKHTRRIDTRDKLRQNAIYDRLIALAADFADRGVHLNKHQIRELFASLIRLGIDNHRQNIINKR